ncbi:prolyl-tRNA synthetase associated domain-containing protein [Cohnella hongkongensis]|uniref:Prolyl-tRNA synthetase associated domain-containing protein n=1 Tax=Cohnella hongkongensis TaxID=178337 RepID=A0ABV9FBJ6_9BACL
MFFVSDIYTTAPSKFKTELQEKTYRVLQDLHIPFERVDTDEAITMNDCVQINKALDMKMVKTLFLCNRKQTEFFLFVTTADKSFSAKEFSNALGISRVSFAPADLMEKMLGTTIGAATVFSALLDKDNRVQIIFDKDVLAEEWYGCSDGTTTGYMKIKTSQVFHDFLKFAKHSPKTIHV